MVTYDRDGNGTIYVDGAVASGNYNPMSIADLAAGSMDSAWQVRMGQRTLNEQGSATRWPYKGTLDEVSIYNHQALSASDVYNRYLDPEAAGKFQYYMMARYQDAGYGRFTQADYWEPGFLTPQALTPTEYAYVGGNPVSRTDPSGHWWPVVACVAGGAAGMIAYDVTTPRSSFSPGWELGSGALGCATGVAISTVGPSAVAGAVGNTAFYLWSTPRDQWTWRDALLNASVGAASGGAATAGYRAWRYGPRRWWR